MTRWTRTAVRLHYTRSGQLTRPVVLLVLAGALLTSPRQRHSTHNVRQH